MGRPRPPWRERVLNRRVGFGLLTAGLALTAALVLAPIPRFDQLTPRTGTLLEAWRDRYSPCRQGDCTRTLVRVRHEDGVHEYHFGDVPPADMEEGAAITVWTYPHFKGFEARRTWHAEQNGRVLRDHAPAAAVERRIRLVLILLVPGLVLGGGWIAWRYPRSRATTAATPAASRRPVMDHTRARLSALLLIGAAAAAAPAAAQQADSWCFTGFHPGEVSGTVWLPEGDLFCTLLADPKAEHSFISYVRGDFPSLRDGMDVGGDIGIGAVGLGDAFPLVRFGGGAPGNGLQVGIVGSIFAQFDLDTESFDLINADYLVGVPVTFRRSGFSTRLRLYHQSSHLGDEFLLRTDLERENLSFEALELLFSQDLGPVRVYGGGEYLFNRDPRTLEETLAHGGVEVRLGALRGVRFVGAVDAKAAEQHDWEPGLSARAGIELAHWRDESHPPRLWGVLVEYYDGPSPYGQFFQEQVRWLGLGLHLSL